MLNLDQRARLHRPLAALVVAEGGRAAGLPEAVGWLGPGAEDCDEREPEAILDHIPMIPQFVQDD
jgi:hypothetical protein